MESVRVMDVARRAAWLLACAFVTNCALAGPGDLDANFGTNGIARHLLPGSGPYTRLSPGPGAVQRDGKILIVGTVDPTQNDPVDDNPMVVRLNTDGSLDASFSGDGIATFNFGGGDSAAALLITADDKIVVVGRTFGHPAVSGAKLARLNTDGSLDATFGQNGVATYPSFSDVGVASFVELSDGRFVLGGYKEGLNDDFVLFAVRSNGALDTTFGTGGRQVVDFEGANDRIVDLRRLPGDRVVAVGVTNDNGVQSIGLMLVNSAGQLDTSFGSGVASYNIDGWNSVNDIELQADGKLLIAGGMLGRSFPVLGMVLRLNLDGTIDRSFGSEGRIVRSDEIQQIVSAANGRIFFAGHSLADVIPPYGRSRGFVEAVERDGAPATTFAGSGGTTLEAGRDGLVSDFTTRALLRQTDGRLVVVGESARKELVAIGIAASGEHSGIISVAQVGRPASDVPYAVNESSPSVSFAVERSGGSHGSVTVNYVAESATAVAGQDFVATAGTLTWGDGETAAKIVTLPLIDDTDYESGELIDFRIFNPTGGASLGTSVTAAAVSSDESTTQIFLRGAQIREGGGTMSVLALRGGDARVRAVVQYSVTSNSLATPNVDFTPISGTLTWEPYDMAPKIIAVPILDDAVLESPEEVRIQLSSAAPGVTAFASVVGTILDDDGSNSGNSTRSPVPNLVPEGAGSFVFTVVRPDDNGAVTANLSIIALTGSNVGGADLGALDFPQLTWAVNDFTTRTVTLPIVDDAVAEGAEDFAVLMEAPGYSNGIESFTIMDDDVDLPGPARLSFAQAQMNVAEGVGSVSVTVNRSGAAAFGVEAEVVFSGVTTSDYTFSGSTLLRWAGGDSTPRTIVIGIDDDAAAEPPKALIVGLRNLTGGITLGPIASSRVNIADDDGFIGTVGFTESEIVVSEDARYVELPVAIAGTSAFGAGVNFALRNGGTATAGREFVFERGRDSWSVSADYPTMFRIYLNGDAQFENEETFTVDLVRNSPIPLGQSSVTVRLVSDDASMPPIPMQVGFVTTAVTQREDQAVVNVSVRRTGASDSAVAVRYETAAGTATAGADFVAATGELQWAEGDTADKTIALMLTNDTAVESTETMSLRLFAPTNGATLAEAAATITITDDDSASSPPPPNNGGSGGGGGGGGGGGSLDLSLLLALLVLAVSTSRRHLAAVAVGLSQIHNDVARWLRTANENVAVSRTVEGRRPVDHRS